MEATCWGLTVVWCVVYGGDGGWRNTDAVVVVVPQSVVRVIHALT